jgi:hypothetical protein
MAARENEFWSPTAQPKCGGLCAKARIIGDFCGLANQRRMLNADGLAEGVGF